MKSRILFIFLAISLTHYTQAQIFENITVLEADSIIKANVDNEIFTIMDVRTPAEYKRDHLENAYQRNFYDDDFKEQMDSLAKKRIYLLYCQSGNRSGQSFNFMKDLGFEHVYNMIGGISEWKAKGLPVTTELP
ncbi:MAG: rhodanese-like domain-containing protein, partial [Bacteroidota bacterium]